MSRGFKAISDKQIKNKKVYTDESGRKIEFPIEPTLPSRSDKGSAGYDFYVSKDIQILPNHTEVIWTDVKAFMEQDEVLSLHVRSSVAIKQGLVLANQVGVIDSSYYDNESNEGNIGVPIKNTSGKSVVLKAGDRIAQGIFTKYLTANDDEVEGKRTGGMGSSGK